MSDRGFSRALAQLVEQYPYKVWVGGSSPSRPIKPSISLINFKLQIGEEVQDARENRFGSFCMYLAFLRQGIFS